MGATSCFSDLSPTSQKEIEAWHYKLMGHNRETTNIVFPNGHEDCLLNISIFTHILVLLSALGKQASILHWVAMQRFITSHIGENEWLLSAQGHLINLSPKTQGTS